MLSRKINKDGVFPNRVTTIGMDFIIKALDMEGRKIKLQIVI